MVTKVKNAAKKVNLNTVKSVWQAAEPEHFIMAGAYVGTGILSESASPGVMAFAYGLVGVLHVTQIVHKKASK